MTNKTPQRPTRHVERSEAKSKHPGTKCRIKKLRPKKHSTVKIPTGYISHITYNIYL